jgi:hypothetical protein
VSTFTGDIHSTDLVRPCMREVQLTRAGRAVRYCTTALYQGLLFHAVAQHWHERRDYTLPIDDGIMQRAAVSLANKLREERRPMTGPVADAQAELKAEVREWADAYVRRYADWYAGAKVIGCELPVRWSCDVDGKREDFASHIDLLLRVGDQLYVRDWKTGKEAPTRAYLDRNMQMGMYALAIAEGDVLLDGDWVSFGDVPVVQWVHVRGLLPVKRVTDMTDETGATIRLAKGDLRPDNYCARDIEVLNFDAIKAEFATRARMFRAGLFPTTPTIEGCQVCEARQACPHWSSEPARQGAST